MCKLKHQVNEWTRFVRFYFASLLSDKTRAHHHNCFDSQSDRVLKILTQVHFIFLLKSVKIVIIGKKNRIFSVRDYVRHRSWRLESNLAPIARQIVTTPAEHFLATSTLISLLLTSSNEALFNTRPLLSLTNGIASSCVSTTFYFLTVELSRVFACSEISKKYNSNCRGEIIIDDDTCIRGLFSSRLTSAGGSLVVRYLKMQFIDGSTRNISF